ncbi:MAG TPA: hypothetical protein VLJ39_10485 [Tepidisphaeraceae bacterium]|nr:hypothetical protein [Tepidisphaeraceae bacterium]
MRKYPLSVWLVPALAAVWVVGCSKSSLSTPKDAAKTFATALVNGDTETANKASTGADPKTVESLVKAASNMKKLQDAAVAKFGDQGKDVSGGGEESNFADLPKKLDDAEVTQTGDTATVTPKNGRPLKLKKVGDDWKVDMSEMASGPMASMAGAMFDSMGKAAAETTDEVNAGKYKSVGELRDAMQKKMMGAALGSVKGPGPQ